MNFAGGRPWILPSASAMRWKTAMDFCFTHFESVAAGNELFDFGKIALLFV
jgi:hypothetical protein